MATKSPQIVILLAMVVANLLLQHPSPLWTLHPLPLVRCNIELGVSTVIGLPAVALASPAPILVLLSLPQDNCNLTYRSLSLSWQELMHSKETLVSLGYQTMKQWSLSNWNFPRNLVLGKGRGLKLVPVGGGTCLLEKDPTQLVRPLCRRQSGDHAG